MSLSDFGSWASIISLVIGLITGFFACKIKVKVSSNKKENKIWSFLNIGNTKQSNK